MVSNFWQRWVFAGPSQEVTLGIKEFSNHKQRDNNLPPPVASDTSPSLATESRTGATGVAKPVIINADGEYHVCVMPATCRMDMEILSWLLGASKIHLASKDEIARLFPNHKPEDNLTLNEMLELPTILDKRITSHTNILFQASKGSKVIQIDIAKFERKAAPQILDFCY